jgi:hypothetical protein
MSRRVERTGKGMYSAESPFMDLDLRLANLGPTQSLGDLRKPPIKAEKGGASFGSCQMKRIREVHPLDHPVQGRCGQSGILQRHPREPCQDAGASLNWGDG